MIIDMLEKSLIAAVLSFGSLLTSMALRQKRKNLVAVRRHRPEPWGQGSGKALRRKCYFQRISSLRSHSFWLPIPVNYSAPILHRCR